MAVGLQIEINVEGAISAGLSETLNKAMNGSGNKRVENGESTHRPVIANVTEANFLKW